MNKESYNFMDVPKIYNTDETDAISCFRTNVPSSNVIVVLIKVLENVIKKLYELFMKQGVDKIINACVFSGIE